MTKPLNTDILAALRSAHGPAQEPMRLRVTDAALDPVVTMQYLEGQSAAYRAFAVQNAQLPNWVSHPAGVVSLVTVTDSKGEMVAGVRLHVRRNAWLLPVEERIVHPQLVRLLSQDWAARAVELCGGWVARSHRKSGLSEFMFLGAVALAAVSNAAVVCGCAHTAAMPLYERYGMSFDRTRAFAYPDDRYQTFAGLVDLKFAARPGHPARTAFHELMDAFGQGRMYDFDPATATEWECPRAPELDWRRVLGRKAARKALTASATPVQLAHC